MKKQFLLMALALVATANSALAAIGTSDETAILSGVASSDALFYKVGGAILVVMAGIWGFKRVRSML